MTVTSVRGMGGVGKTQLANEYAYRHATDYDVVWWIAAEEPALIPYQFTALAIRLGLEPTRTLNLCAKRCTRSCSGLRVGCWCSTTPTALTTSATGYTPSRCRLVHRVTCW